MKQAMKINQETVNAALPSIPQAFEQQMCDMIRHLPEQRKETPVMKRKISVGLVLALVLMLLAVSALAAALLGSRDFVDQIMAPMARQNQEEDRYTDAQLQEILRIAEENDIHLPENILARLEKSEDGEYKEELMRVFLKTEYGFYPSAWPLEVQHWYEEMLEACGQGDGHIASVLPEGEDELSRQEALEKAIAFLRQTYGETADLTDPEHYRLHMQYTETIVNPYLKTREWYLEFEALDLVSNIYYLTMAQDGTIESHSMCGGIYAPSSQMRGQFISDRFALVYGNGYGQTQWTTELLQEFQKALRHRIDTEGESSVLAREKHVLYQTYPAYDEAGMISADEAWQIALDFMKDYPLNELYSSGMPVILMAGENGPVWKTMVVVDREKNRIGRAYIEMDARTGKITASDTSFESSQEWRVYVTEAYWEKNKPAAAISPAHAGPTVRPDHKPWMWYNEMFPGWYWEKLDAVNYNGDTAGDLMNAWYRDYGEDSLFWPLEAQAIDFYWHNIYGEGDAAFPGLPSDTDVPQAEALAIARAEWENRYSRVLGEMNLTMEDVICGVSFWFNRPQRDVNCWQFTLMNKAGGVLGYAYLDARDGSVLGLGLWNDDMDAILAGQDSAAATPAPTPSPRPDGLPWYWGDAAIPESHWEYAEKAMAEMGITPDTFDAYVETWRAGNPAAQEGGNLEQFWPQTPAALYYLLRLWSPVTGDENDYMLLAGEMGTISQEEAVKIAEAAFREYCRGQVEEEWLNSLRVSSFLWNKGSHSETPYWLIQFHEPGEEFNTRGWAYVDAFTGEMLLLELDFFGNG